MTDRIKDVAERARQRQWMPAQHLSANLAAAFLNMIDEAKVEHNNVQTLEDLCNILAAEMSDPK